MNVNNKSVISLTAGVFSLLIPFIGLVPGVIGIAISRKATKELVKTNEKGHGLAIAGLICSIAGIVLQLFAILGLIAYYSVTNVA